MRLRKRLCNVLLFFCLAGGLLLCLRAGLADVADASTATSQGYYTLPYSGPNFQAYSLFWHAVGRAYLRGTTAAVVLDAYKELRTTMPNRFFIYGETGLNGGGRFWPHRTHREGRTVDFITPMLRSGEPATLSCMPWNLWSYSTRLDAQGRTGDLQLDVEALIAHLAALKAAAPRHALRIKQVILDPPLLRILRASPRFQTISGLPFMKKAAWFPHDSHYHVDFAPR